MDSGYTPQCLAVHSEHSVCSIVFLNVAANFPCTTMSCVVINSNQATLHNKFQRNHQGNFIEFIIFYKRNIYFFVLLSTIPVTFDPVLRFQCQSSYQFIQYLLLTTFCTVSISGSWLDITNQEEVKYVRRKLYTFTDSPSACLFPLLSSVCSWLAFIPLPSFRSRSFSASIASASSLFCFSASASASVSSASAFLCLIFSRIL